MQQRIERIGNESKCLSMKQLTRRRKAYVGIGTEIGTKEIRCYILNDADFRPSRNSLIETLLENCLIFLGNEFKKFKQRGKLDSSIQNEPRFLLARISDLAVNILLPNKDESLYTSLSIPLMKNMIEHVVESIGLLIDNVDGHKLLEGYIDALAEIASSKRYVELCLTREVLKKLFVSFKNLMKVIRMERHFHYFRLGDLLYNILRGTSYNLGGKSMEMMFFVMISDWFTRVDGTEHIGSEYLILDLRLIDCLTEYIHCNGINKISSYRAYFEDVVVYCITDITERKVYSCFKFLRSLLDVCLQYTNSFDVQTDLVLHFEDYHLLSPEFIFDKLLTLDVSSSNNRNGYIEYSRCVVDYFLLLSSYENPKANQFICHCIDILYERVQLVDCSYRSFIDLNSCLHFIFYLFSSSSVLLGRYMNNNGIKTLEKVLVWSKGVLSNMVISKSLTQESSQVPTPSEMPKKIMFWCFYILRSTSYAFYKSQESTKYARVCTLYEDNASLVVLEFWPRVLSAYKILSIPQNNVEQHKSTLPLNLPIIVESVMVLASLLGTGILKSSVINIIFGQILEHMNSFKLRNSSKISVDWINLLVLLLLRGQFCNHSSSDISRDDIGKWVFNVFKSSGLREAGPLFGVSMLLVYFPRITPRFKLDIYTLYLHEKPRTNISVSSMKLAVSPLDKNFIPHSAVATLEQQFYELFFSFKDITLSENLSEPALMAIFIGFVYTLREIYAIKPSYHKSYKDALLAMFPCLLKQIATESTINALVSNDLLVVLGFYKRTMPKIFTSEAYLQFLVGVQPKQVITRRDSFESNQETLEQSLDTAFEASISTQGQNIPISTTEPPVMESSFTDMIIVSKTLGNSGSLDLCLVHPVLSIFAGNQLSSVVVDIFCPVYVDEQLLLLNFANWLFCLPIGEDSDLNFEKDEYVWILKRVLIQSMPNTSFKMLLYLNILKMLQSTLVQSTFEKTSSVQKLLTSAVRINYFLKVTKKNDYAILDKFLLRVNSKVEYGVYIASSLRIEILKTLISCEGSIDQANNSIMKGVISNCLGEKDYLLRLECANQMTEKLFFEKAVEVCLSSMSLYVILGSLKNSFALYSKELAPIPVENVDGYFAFADLSFDIQILLKTLDITKISGIPFILVLLLLYSLDFGVERVETSIHNKSDNIVGISKFHLLSSKAFIRQIAQSMSFDCSSDLLYNFRYEVIEKLSKLVFKFDPFQLYDYLLEVEYELPPSGSQNIMYFGFVNGILRITLNETFNEHLNLKNPAKLVRFDVLLYFIFKHDKQVSHKLSSIKCSPLNAIDILLGHCLVTSISQRLKRVNLAISHYVEREKQVDIVSWLKRFHPCIILGSLSRQIPQSIESLDLVQLLYFSNLEDSNTHLELPVLYAVLLFILKHFLFTLNKAIIKKLLILLFSLRQVLELNIVPESIGVYALLTFHVLAVFGRTECFTKEKASRLQKKWLNSSLYEKTPYLWKKIVDIYFGCPKFTKSEFLLLLQYPLPKILTVGTNVTFGLISISCKNYAVTFLELFLDKVEIYLNKRIIPNLTDEKYLSSLKLLPSYAIKYLDDTLRKKLAWVLARLGLLCDHNIVPSAIQSDAWRPSDYREILGFQPCSWKTKGTCGRLIDFLTLHISTNIPTAEELLLYESFLATSEVKTERNVLYPKLICSLSLSLEKLTSEFKRLWRVKDNFRDWLFVILRYLLNTDIAWFQGLLIFLENQDLLVVQNLLQNILFHIISVQKDLLSECISVLLTDVAKSLDRVASKFVDFILKFINLYRSRRIRKWNALPIEEKRFYSTNFAKTELKLSPFLVMEVCRKYNYNHSVILFAEIDTEGFEESSSISLPVKRTRSNPAMQKLYGLHQSSNLKNALLFSYRALNSDDVNGPVAGITLQEQFETFSYKKDYFNALTMWNQDTISASKNFNLENFLLKDLHFDSERNKRIAKKVTLYENIEWENSSSLACIQTLSTFNFTVGAEQNLSQIKGQLQSIIINKFGGLLLSNKKEIWDDFSFILQGRMLENQSFKYPMLSMFLAHYCSQNKKSVHSKELLQYILKLCVLCFNKTDIQYCREQLNVLEKFIQEDRMKEPKLLLEFRFVQAQYFWAVNEKNTAIFIADSIIEAFSSASENLCDKSFKGEVLCKAGMWQDELAQLPWQKIQEEYFTPATNYLSEAPHQSVGILKASFSSIATYYDSMFFSVKHKVDTTIWRESMLHVDKATNQVKQLDLSQDAAVSNLTARRKLKRRKDNLGKQIALDQKHREEVWANYGHFLRESIRFYGESLLASDPQDSDLKIVFRIFSLWFSHCDVEEESNELIERYFVSETDENVSSAKLLPLLPQIFSRIGDKQESLQNFQSLILKLVLKIGDSFPFNTFKTLISFILEQTPPQLKRTQRESYRMKKIKLIHKSLEKCTVAVYGQKASIVLQTTLGVYRAFHKFAKKKVGTKKSKQAVFYYKDFPKFVSAMKAFNLTNSIMPTATIPILAKDANANLEDITLMNNCNDLQEQEFAVSLSGRSKPKILKFTAHNGRLYKILLKGGDDLRQDFIMEQLFQLVNKLLYSNFETRMRQMKIRVYEVLPISEDTGFIEWVSNTISFGEYLHGPLSGNFNGSAHYRFNTKKGTYSFIDCWKGMTEANKEDTNKKMFGRRSSTSLVKQVTIYNKICQNFLPVFRHFFLETYSEASIWYKRRQLYSRSVACNSMIGYIMGIGDRHTQNLLIDIETAEIVHIDFGYVFEQSKLLSLPERVPFRLTPDIVDGFGITKERGAFQVGSEHVLQLLRESMDVLNTICEVFIHDPLYDWKVSPEKLVFNPSNSMQRTLQESLCPNDFTGDMMQERHSTEVDYEAQRALNKITQKLKGIDFGSGAVFDIPKQVRYLIRDATDEESLARMFAGWAPFV